MSLVTYSVRARNDLSKIWSDIAADSALNADRVIDRLIEMCDLLGRHNQFGEPWSGKHSALRFFPVSGNNYVIFFEPTANGVNIVRIIHGRQQLERIVPQS